MSANMQCYFSFVVWNFFVFRNCCSVASSHWCFVLYPTSFVIFNSTLIVLSSFFFLFFCFRHSYNNLSHHRLIISSSLKLTITSSSTTYYRHDIHVVLSFFCWLCCSALLACFLLSLSQSVSLSVRLPFLPVFLLRFVESLCYSARCLCFDFAFWVYY